MNKTESEKIISELFQSLKESEIIDEIEEELIVAEYLIKKLSERYKEHDLNYLHIMSDRLVEIAIKYHQNKNDSTSEKTKLAIYDLRESIKKEFNKRRIE